MRAGSSFVATAVALGIITLSGCADTGTEENSGPAPGEDWGDETKYPEIGGAYHSLAAFNGTPTFISGVVTVPSGGAQTILISKRAVDSAILINGAEVLSVATPTVPAAAATSTTMKRLVVTGSGSAESLILDFLGGYFAPGVAMATAGSIAIDMGAGVGDIVNIRGTSAADAFFLGSDGISYNADNFKDITITGAEGLNIALAGGADTLTATNAVAIKGLTGNYPGVLTAFGGAGNDVIVGGDGIDAIYGGPGNDTISGGAAADTLFGEDGADIIQGTAAADGTDAINCGDETPTDTSIDIVSYDKRTNVITATLGTTAGEGSELDTLNANCEGVTGGSGNDVLNGDANANTISGGPGNDVIKGGLGDDVLNGGDGNDRFDDEIVDNGSDIFNGGAGTDTVDYSARTVALTVTMDGSDADDGFSGEEDNVKADVENILCGSANDDITGNSLANEITGGLGNDTLDGGGGNDTFKEGDIKNGGDEFIGGAGVDLVDYSARTMAVTVTMGNDLADDGDGTATAEADNVKSDVENLFGGLAADSITGNDLDNLIEGGALGDTISGGDGDDRLDGTDTATSNAITCGEGDDVALNKGTAVAYAADCELKGN